ncbi:acyltransferase [Endozoicomonas montiporae]|uniref:Acyltransferase n=2 Tax=Endozoicomonas montiporae TaxID=1027273 RepID=A0A081N231_9GAMM|nr:1-acyl-sn-glycerol-3-phosphate acyltransferase [Endozoicomonas montiporae]AMO58542.1 hypothetical protein EZMO1_4635 [Endozoicomonas montiporae CL-33]KEQ12504.1 acyltransferase [Endozoicomonas montiporae]
MDKQLQPSPVKAAIGRFVFKLLGNWQIEGRPPAVSKYVIIVAHHTSNWDFIVGIAVKLILGLKLQFFAKHSLFFWPLGVLMRSFGGVPIKRDESINRVDASIDQIKKADEFVLVITPEGTRSKVERWKTGFYHIAKGAEIPIIPVAFDFANKKVIFGAPLPITDNKEHDIKEMHRFFLPYKPRHPELACNGPFETH